MTRIAIVILIDQAGRLFMHRRRHDKRVYPGLWGAGAGGKVDAGELPEAGAARELWEETGLRAEPTPVARFPFEGHDVHVFYARADHVPAPDNREWSEWAWRDRTAVQAMIDAGEVCPDTVEALARLFAVIDRRDPTEG